jgi:hypothetical protein
MTQRSATVANLLTNFTPTYTMHPLNVETNHQQPFKRKVGKLLSSDVHNVTNIQQRCKNNNHQQQQQMLMSTGNSVVNVMG